MTKESKQNKENKALSLDESLQKIADDEKALIMSFIAPSGMIKVSPMRGLSTSINESDLYEIENVIEGLDGKIPEKLFFVIHTPGGELYTSTKIAKYLSQIFKEIVCFVPYEAASGGTILSLIANKIVMDDISSLTPIDPQVYYKGQMISVNSYGEIIEKLGKKFDKVNPMDIPAPWHQLCSNIDPIIYQEMEKKVLDTILVASELLERTYDPKKAVKIAFDLVKGSVPHSHVINFAEAKSMGLSVKNDAESIKKLKCFKKFVRENLNKPNQGNHIIKHFIPRDNQPKTEKENAK